MHCHLVNNIHSSVAYYYYIFLLLSNIQWPTIKSLRSSVARELVIGCQLLLVVVSFYYIDTVWIFVGTVAVLALLVLLLLYLLSTRSQGFY